MGGGEENYELRKIRRAPERELQINEIFNTLISRDEKIGAEMKKPGIDKLTKQSLNYLINLVEKKLRIVKPSKRFDLFSFCLLQKIFNSYESIKILLRGGKLHDAKSILRTIIEAQIYLYSSVEENEAFYEFYEVEGLKRRKGIHSKIERYYELNETDLKRENPLDPAIIKEIEVEFKEKKKNLMSLREMAENVKLSMEYLYVHTDCSGPIHNLPHTIQEYLKHENGRIKNVILKNPVGSNESLILLQTVTSVFKSIDKVNDKHKFIDEKPMIQTANLINSLAWADLVKKGRQELEA